MQLRPELQEVDAGVKRMVCTTMHNGLLTQHTAEWQLGPREICVNFHRGHKLGPNPTKKISFWAPYKATQSGRYPLEATARQVKTACIRHIAQAKADSDN